jgi:hypothetical protein
MYSDGPVSPDVSNCLFWGNAPDQIVGEALVSHSDVQGGWQGGGNFDADPLFVDPDHGDYHLKSEVGRWDLLSQSWVKDNVTSPCIDAGDPNMDWIAEPWPHGQRINVGAYGGTAQASMSSPGVDSVGDLDGGELQMRGLVFAGEGHRYARSSTPACGLRASQASYDRALCSILCPRAAMPHLATSVVGEGVSASFLRVPTFCPGGTNWPIVQTLQGCECVGMLPRHTAFLGDPLRKERNGVEGQSTIPLDVLRGRTSSRFAMLYHN